MSKMPKVIQLCEEPQRFSDLKKPIGISDAGLTKHLKGLQKLGWIRKMEDGRYELTDSGRQILPHAQRAESVLANFKTAPRIHDNVVVQYLGVEGEDGEALLDRINKAVKGYLKKHPDKPFTVMALYRSKK